MLPLLLPCDVDGAAMSQGRTGAVHLHLQLGQRAAGQSHHHLPALAAAAAGLGADVAAADSRDPGSAAGTPPGEPRASGVVTARGSSGGAPGAPPARPIPFGRAPSAPHPLAFSAGVGAGDSGIGFGVGAGPGGTSGGGGGGLGAAGGSVAEAHPLGAEGQGGAEGLPMGGASLGRGGTHERPLQGRRTDPGPAASGGGTPRAGVEGDAGMGAGAEAGGRVREGDVGGGAGPGAPLQLLVGPSQYESLIAMCIGAGQTKGSFQKGESCHPCVRTRL